MNAMGKLQAYVDCIRLWNGIKIQCVQVKTFTNIDSHFGISPILLTNQKVGHSYKELKFINSTTTDLFLLEINA